MKRAMICLYKCINQGNPMVGKSVIWVKELREAGCKKAYSDN